MNAIFVKCKLFMKVFVLLYKNAKEGSSVNFSET